MLILHKNICCDPSSEQSHQDGSDEESQHKISMRNRKNYPSIVIKYPSYMYLSRVLNILLLGHFKGNIICLFDHSGAIKADDLDPLGAIKADDLNPLGAIKVDDQFCPSCSLLKIQRLQGKQCKSRRGGSA